MAEARKLFEEVGEGARRGPAPGPRPADGRSGARRAISLWLLTLFVMVAAMIVIGGLTRLTDSGLSITEWKPVTGALPPMSAEAWTIEFDKYKASPEYQLQNKGMSLEAFKVIYWWEWGHRLLGRLVGLVWFVGLAWFLARRMVPAGWTGRLVGIGVLGGLQGAVGWWMVSSGLQGRMVDVASYRLAIHLGLAFLILSLIAWWRFELARGPAALLQARRNRETSLVAPTNLFLWLLGFQVLLGALVAGIDAGRGYIDWPLMGGAVLPSESFDYVPWWSNWFENPALVQFNHRIVGYLAVIAGVSAWMKSRSSPNPATRTAFLWMAVFLGLQVVLGIATVMNAAPLVLASAHQVGAIVLVVVALRARFAVHYPQSASVRG